MIRIAIVDEEPAIIRKNEKIVREYFQIRGVITEIQTFQKGQLFLYELEEDSFFDVCFLEIELPDISGMSIAREIRKRTDETLIVFLTIHLEYAMDCYVYRAFRFLSKMDAKEKLIDALQDLYIELEKNDGNYYVISTKSRYEKVLYKDIFYLFKSRQNVVFVLENRETYVRKNLVEVYRELNTEEFIYIDRGYIVNVFHVMNVNKNQVTLRNGEILQVSRPMIGKVKETINRYWREN